MTDALIPFEGGIQVIKRRSVFDRHHNQTVVVQYNMQSIEDLYIEHMPANLPCTCALSGKIIPREEWSLTFVGKNDSVLFTPELQGGNSGKGIIGALLIIAAVAAYIYLPYMAPAWAEAIKFGALMVGSAGASLLITALLPIPAVETDSSSITSWSQQTTQAQGGCVPKYYGRHKVSGNIIASHLENVGEKQFIYALICLGMGPVHNIFDFKLNDIPFDLLQKTQDPITVRKGLLTQGTLPGFADTTVEYPVSQKLLKDTPYVLSTSSGGEPNKLKFHLLCPAGLGYVNDDGGIDSTSVRVRVEIKKRADTNWMIIPASKELSTGLEGSEIEPGWILGNPLSGFGYGHGDTGAGDGGEGEHSPATNNGFGSAAGTDGRDSFC